MRLDATEALAPHDAPFRVADRLIGDEDVGTVLAPCGDEAAHDEQSVVALGGKVLHLAVDGGRQRDSGPVEVQPASAVAAETRATMPEGSMVMPATVTLCGVKLRMYMWDLLRCLQNKKQTRQKACLLEVKRVEKRLVVDMVSIVCIPLYFIRIRMQGLFGIIFWFPQK